MRVEPEGTGSPCRAATDGRGYAALDRAAKQAHGRPLAFVGQGGSIPLCGALAQHFPESELVLMGVEEPSCAIHAANESVDPGEIERIAAACAAVF